MTRLYVHRADTEPRQPWAATSPAWSTMLLEHGNRPGTHGIVDVKSIVDKRMHIATAMRLEGEWRLEMLQGGPLIGVRSSLCVAL